MNVATILKDKGHMVVTVKPETTLLEAAQTLSAHRIGAAIVVDAAGAIEGIVSERDIVRAVAKSGAACLGVALRDIMTTEVQTCGEADSIDHVMQVMTRGRFRHLPVVAREQLKGLVSTAMVAVTV